MAIGRIRPTFDLSKTLFIGTLVLGVFVYGAAVGRYQIFPFTQVQFAWGSVQQVFAEREVITGTRPVFLLERSRYPGRGVTHVEKDRMAPGFTLLTGFFDTELEMRLVRPDGSIVNRWPTRFHQIFPDASHIKPADRIPQTDWNVGIQGTSLAPDGSVVFNFEGLGLAKLDRCGAVQWTVPQMTHHSVDRAEDGGFWVPSMRYVETSSPFPGLKPPFDEDTILRVSADGKILQQISVLGLFFENHLEALLFANGLEAIRLPEKQNLTHVNDVEELKRDMANHFPQFAAGDLLVSLRNYNLLMVVDPRTHRVKWHQTGPWIKQHDPDFEPNGTISVFNNNSDGTDAGTVFGGSDILEIDPVTGTTRVEYGDDPAQKLFTKLRGKHQQLANGNMLIAESHAGRVIEVDAQGKIVWEFINRYDADSVAIVAGASRYREEYFAVKDWSCSPPSVSP